MKHVLIIFFILYASLLSSRSTLFDLSVTVENVQSAEGTVRIGLFTNEEEFLTTTLRNGDLDVQGSTSTYVFKGLPKGTYAISLFHDENGNGELDSNFMGIPKEPYAFSNNAKGMFGPPSFEECKFQLEYSMAITIKL